MCLYVALEGKKRRVKQREKGEMEIRKEMGEEISKWREIGEEKEGRRQG